MLARFKLLTIKRILKEQKTIYRILRNKGRKITDFHKTVNDKVTEICELGKKKFQTSTNFTEKSHMHTGNISLR